MYIRKPPQAVGLVTIKGLQMMKEHNKKPINKQTTTPPYWQDIEESVQNPQASQEFASHPTSIEENTIERRDFLKLMGASLALTSMSCIRRPVEKIVPYANRPEEIEPGISNYYCSTYTAGGQGQSIVVKTREGRPIYLTGNPQYPTGGHGISLQAQAHILNLYDPDRLQSPYHITKSEKKAITWEKLDKEVKQALSNGSIGLLTGSVSSPSTQKLLTDFFNTFSGKHYQWDIMGADDVMEGQRLSFGQATLPRLQFDKAKMIVSVGADFLGTWLTPQAFSADFAKGRKPPEMNKLVVFEGLHSLTGANADLRVPLPPSQFLHLIMALLYEIVITNQHTSSTISTQVRSAINLFAHAAQATGVDPALIAQIAKDLWNQRGKSLVVAGGLTARTFDAMALQVATNLLNTVLESDGNTIDPHFSVTSFNGSYANMYALIDDLEAGRVKTLIISGVNPIYAYPALQKSLKKANTVIYIGDRLDETALASDLVAPLSHQMETWGDAELVRGVYSIQQPTIRPLYDTRALEENLLIWQQAVKDTDENTEETKEKPSWYAYLKNQWRAYHRQIQSHFIQVPGKFEDFWIDTLHKGFVTYRPYSGAGRPPRVFRREALSHLVAKPATNTSLELSLYAKASIGDGCFANNAWLQELPDPVTKVVWDNYLLMSPHKAKELGFKQSGEHAKLDAHGYSVTLPILIAPGTHDQVVGLAVGYGRKQAGKVGTGIGSDAYPFVQNGVFAGVKASVTKAEGWTTLANTQGHHRMEGRQLVVEATLKDYLKSPSANIHRHKMFSLYPKHEYKGHRWGMAIDLNACIGCSACMVACQSENNIPTVGKKYVLQGREMHWIRIDRYYTGDEADPDVVFQPMLCQHCENASCEAVCPVVATVHGEEGLNQMIYNRCVGTRYCSNNCPYKVRRFNWFNYSQVASSLKKAFNPNVTVRTRGVMEKCTFCTQRIKEAKVLAKREKRIFKGEDVVTACQEACPTNAIVFGDVNDSHSQVSQVFQEERSFSVLEEFNNVPMVRYQTKIRNTDKLKGGGHHA